MNKELFRAKRWLFCRREIASFSALKQNEQMSAEELAELNWRRRKEIVSHAFDNSDFYHRKYAAVGFEPGDLKEPADFERLPILEKQEIRENTSDMVGRGYDESSLKFLTTGGSTGVPLKTYIDPNAPASEIGWRTLNWWGVDASDNSAYIYRSVPLGTRRLMQQVMLWPTRRNWMYALDMDEALMERFYRRLLIDKPTYLIGYVGGIDIFANFMERNNYRLDGVKAVWTTAAPLNEGKRQYLQSVLNAPTYTQYGSCEFYWIAADCKQQAGMHIASDVRHVDVVEGNTAVPLGENGDLVVTDLMNRAFPLIRYRLGDRGRLLGHQCACGLPFPMMDYVMGRVSDKIYLPNGTMIPGEAFCGMFRAYPDTIKSFQIRQSADYGITIRYEPLPGKDCSDAMEDLGKKLDAQFLRQVGIDFVEGPVEVNDNGKTRFVVSEIEP